MNSNQHLQKQDVELQKKIEASKLKLQNLNVEVQDVQKRTSAKYQEIEAETQRLLAERARKFAEQEAAALKQLKAIQKAVNEAQNQEEALGDSIVAKRHEVAKIDDLLVTKQAAIKQLEDAKFEANQIKHDMSGIQTEVVQLNSRKATLLEDIRLLELTKADKEAEVNALDDKINQANEKLVAIKLDAEAIVAEKEAKVEQLDHVIYDKRQEYAKFDVDMDNVRSDLANREQKLTDRDQNLRIREQKVIQDEAKIQQNANLLNL